MEKLIRSYLIAFFVSIIIFLPQVSIAGGPWTKAKGKYYLKLSEWGLKFDSHYTDTGQIDPNITTGIYNTFLYAEYGLTDRFTTIFNGNLFSRNVMNNQRSQTTNEIVINGDALNSVGDMELGLKYSLSKPGAKIPMAISVQLGIPTGVTGKGEFGTLQTGDGEFNQMVQFDIGSGFNIKSSNCYFSAYAALNNRTNGFSEEYRTGAELGIELLQNKLWLSTKLNVIKSFKNGELATEVNSTSIFANNSEFTSIGFEANYYITDKIGVSANFTSAVSGRIIAAAPSYNFGVFIDIN
jgi:hypothetical protein